MVSERPAPGAQPDYHERLTPSLWVIFSVAVLAPMVTLVFVPLNRTLSLVIGGFVAVGLVALLQTVAPRIDVRDGVLRAGRAHIPVALLGATRQFRGTEARYVRGPGLDGRSWHLIRGGIDGLVVIEVIDPDDPAPAWIVSTRTPDRLAAAIHRAQTEPAPSAAGR